MTVCEILTVVLIMLDMILVGGFALIIAYGIQHCTKLKDRIEESLRNQESSDDVPQESVIVPQESVIVPNERKASPTYTMTIEGETVTYEGKTCAEIIAEIEKKKAPSRVRHLAFSAKKFRIRKKNRARLKKYEREHHIQEREISVDRQEGRPCHCQSDVQ